MDELLEVDFAAAGKDRLYRYLDRILPHKDAVCQHLTQRWKTLFDTSFDMLLYDLTRTYFEGLCEQIPKAKHDYRRDGGSACLPVISTPCFPPLLHGRVVLPEGSGGESVRPGALFFHHEFDELIERGRVLQDRFRRSTLGFEVGDVLFLELWPLDAVLDLPLLATGDPLCRRACRVIASSIRSIAKTSPVPAAARSA
jgi:hypothetical protein